MNVVVVAATVGLDAKSLTRVTWRNLEEQSYQELDQRDVVAGTETNNPL